MGVRPVRDTLFILPPERGLKAGGGTQPGSEGLWGPPPPASHSYGQYEPKSKHLSALRPHDALTCAEYLSFSQGKLKI